MDKFWFSSAENYSKKGFEINLEGTHPSIIKKIKKHNFNKILDYGCGDGSLLYNLGDKYEYSIYDISKEMLRLAEDKLKNFKLNTYKHPKDIPLNYYDAVILSMVLICVESKKEFNFILKKIKECKKKEGILYIANPHSCFRNISFSSYYTEFSIGKEFDYFKNGQPHKLYTRNGLEFTDFNWTISYLINTLIKCGFNILSIDELNDNKTNSFYNKNFSPSIIITCK